MEQLADIICPDILHLSPFGNKIYCARLCQGPCLKPLLCNMVLLDINFQLPGSLLTASCCTGVMKALSALSISGKSFCPQLMLQTLRFWLTFATLVRTLLQMAPFSHHTFFQAVLPQNLPAARLPASKQFGNSHWPLVCMYAESQVFSDQRVCL